jgi:NADP-reducing hydrogenase subunit HndB
MAKLKNVEELLKLAEAAKQELTVRTRTGTRLIIGLGACGIAAGAREVMHALMKALAERGIEANVETMGCAGMCAREPLVEVERAGQPRVTYGNVTPERAGRIVEEHLSNGKVIEEWVVARPKEGELQ